MKTINNKKDAIQELKRISARTNSENNSEINAIVEDILQEVKNYGDIAVEKYTKKFDGFNPDPMQVNADQLKDAWNEIDDNLKRSLEGLIKESKDSMKKRYHHLLLLEENMVIKSKGNGDQLKMQVSISLVVELLTQVLY